MKSKKWVIAAIARVRKRDYPVVTTAVVFAALPVLVRMGSSYVEGELRLNAVCAGARAVPVMSLAVLIPSVAGFLKYASRKHLLAYGHWVTTYLSVAVLGIVMFEAFSPPRQWSGSLVLPGWVMLNCAAGILAGAGVARVPWRRRRC